MKQALHPTELPQFRSPVRGLHLVSPSPRPMPIPEPRAVERRSSPRVSTNDAAMMRVLEPYSPVRWMVCITSVSATGFRLIAPTPLKPGHLIQINVKNVNLLAVVRHC